MTPNCSVRIRSRIACTVGVGSLVGACAAATFIALPPVDAATAFTPQTIQLTGVVRDFIERTLPGGHPDMERQPASGFGLYCKNIAQTLDAEHKPVFVGGGKKVSTQWRTSAATGSKPICWTQYSPGPPHNDQNATLGATDSGGITSAASFAQWFRDVPGVNLSLPLTLTLVRQPDGRYVFDDKLDPLYSSKGGFFPIDDQLFGNSSGTPVHNFHFTFELQTEFIYDATIQQDFKFVGDDDVFVFVNGQLVIDLGGVHSAQTQHVDVHRLGLVHGQTYPLSFFFAERHRTQSNFRIETTLNLQNVEPPGTNNAYD